MLLVTCTQKLQYILDLIGDPYYNNYTGQLYIILFTIYFVVYDYYNNIVYDDAYKAIICELHKSRFHVLCR